MSEAYFTQPFGLSPFNAPTWWVSKAPGETLTWSETLTPYMSPTDVIASVQASIAPHGAGELSAASISVIGQTVNLTLTSGQPLRIYTIQFLVTCTNGAVYQPTVNIRVRPLLPTDQPSSAPVDGFGSTISWNGGVVSQTIGLLGTAFITAAGTTQAGATPIDAVVSIINGGTAGILMPPISGLIYGTLTQTNIIQNAVTLYPWPGDSFIGHSVNQGVAVPAGSSLAETLVQGATAWALASL